MRFIRDIILEKRAARMPAPGMSRDRSAEIGADAAAFAAGTGRGAEPELGLPGAAQPMQPDPFGDEAPGGLPEAPPTRMAAAAPENEDFAPEDDDAEGLAMLFDEAAGEAAGEATGEAAREAAREAAIDPFPEVGPTNLFVDPDLAPVAGPVAAERPPATDAPQRPSLRPDKATSPARPANRPADWPASRPSDRPRPRTVEDLPFVSAEAPPVSADPVQVPPPAAGRGSNRSGRVKTRLLGFNPDGYGLADPFERAESRAAVAAAVAFPVGWLVVVAGPGRGAAFALRDGVSRIGRGEDQAVSLNFGDNSISRENHLSVAYDAEQNAFYVGQSGRANLVRLNNRPLLSTEPLRSGDQLRVGETTLRFVALCDEGFAWSETPAADRSHG